MTVNALSAANAYSNQLKLAGAASDDTGESDNSGSPFATMLTNSLQSAADTQRATEHTEMQNLTGKGDLTDLITAVSNAELSLNTIVSVRDRVISAYNDIIKMSI